MVSLFNCSLENHMEPGDWAAFTNDIWLQPSASPLLSVAARSGVSLHVHNQARVDASGHLHGAQVAHPKSATIASRDTANAHP